MTITRYIEPDGTTALLYQERNQRQTASGTWYRGDDCNFLPPGDFRQDLDWIDKWILKGWIPDGPFITSRDVFSTFGSCFAREVSKFLSGFGFDMGDEKTYLFMHGAGMVNTFTILQQLLWAWGKKEDDLDGVCYISAAEQLKYTEDMRIRTRAMLDGTTVFVITLGLSEVWRDRKTGLVFWKAVPAEIYDPQRHEFIVSTVDQNLKNLEDIVQTIRSACPDAHIIFTLSPVPLVATFRPVSCITANSVSKAILRVAVDELVRGAHIPRLWYWPSYEVVMAHSDPYLPDNRHVRPEIIEKMMQTFRRVFIKES